jgi:hypothetical protein
MPDILTLETPRPPRVAGSHAIVKTFYSGCRMVFEVIRETHFVLISFEVSYRNKA